MATSGALPVVDLAPFFAGDDEGAVARATDDAVREACRTHGFFRAVNHGVPAELMARALELSAAFFALPDEEKAKEKPKVRAAEGTSRPPLRTGYGQQPAHTADKNEYLVIFDPKLGINAYPAEPAAFSGGVLCQAHRAGVARPRDPERGHGPGPPGFLKNYNKNRGFDLMTARRYFPETEQENNGFTEHEDASCFTFILQDHVGGLEVLKDGDWVPAEPVDGSIIVNIGDVIQQQETEERDAPGGEEIGAQALVRLLLQPARRVGDKWVEPLPELTAKIGEAPRYRRFLYKEYQQLRVRNKTHPPAWAEDIVDITHYAI
ncbi:hypothetical protein U9M48_034034 [Paspalum notatum var. saurae]|uniref:Fe2OG dioxygenase domain-containing protein n=1 Tax=Paspalum notatum var. saurae TaxID=547442 RepID=A0AAQ3U9Q9_PASNO